VISLDSCALQLPGYGLSTLKTKATTRAKGGSLLEACQEAFPGRDIILGGHDRGARLCHRVSVDHAHPPSSTAPSYKLLGTVLIDIVPTLIQWQAFANPKAGVAYYHWPFLASPTAAEMIHAYGGDRWVHNGLSRIQGDSAEGQAKFQSDNAWEVYESQFTKRETIEGSCADYAAGADPEPQAQAEDQKAGRKMQGPVLVMWSLARLGSMHGDVGSIWKDWVENEAQLKAIGCGDGVGHYLPEESHNLIGNSILDFVKKVST